MLCWVSHFEHHAYWQGLFCETDSATQDNTPFIEMIIYVLSVIMLSFFILNDIVLTDLMINVANLGIIMIRLFMLKVIG